VIESVKTVSDIYAPVEGTVVEANNSVAHDPSLLSNDPYVGGWLVKLKVAPGVDTSHLLDKAGYDKIAVPH
jgi:glycine cleavage system H protein